MKIRQTFIQQDYTFWGHRRGLNNTLYKCINTNKPNLGNKNVLYITYGFVLGADVNSSILR